MERKFQSLNEVKIDRDQRTIKGYASVFGGVDSYDDTIVKGAYAKSIAASTKGLRMLYQHRSDYVIGRWTSLKEDDHGLIVEGVLTPGHSMANDVYASLKAGHIDGLSIGYNIRPGGMMMREDGIRVITDIDLREVSVVGDPADEAALIETVKSNFLTMSIRELEQHLVREARMPASIAKAILAGGYKSLNVKRDADGEHEPEALQKALIDAIRSVKG